MKDFVNFVKDFFTAREPGCGYFGGAEGALRFVFFMFVALIADGIYFLM